MELVAIPINKTHVNMKEAGNMRQESSVESIPLVDTLMSSSV